MSSYLDQILALVTEQGDPRPRQIGSIDYRHWMIKHEIFLISYERYFDFFRLLIYINVISSVCFLLHRG